MRIRRTFQCQRPQAQPMQLILNVVNTQCLVTSLLPVLLNCWWQNVPPSICFSLSEKGGTWNRYSTDNINSKRYSVGPKGCEKAQANLPASNYTLKEGGVWCIVLYVVCSCAGNTLVIRGKALFNQLIIECRCLSNIAGEHFFLRGNYSDYSSGSPFFGLFQCGERNRHLTALFHDVGVQGLPFFSPTADMEIYGNRWGMDGAWVKRRAAPSYFVTSTSS